MKKEDVINKLLELLAGMRMHDCFSKELREIIVGKTGCEQTI